MKENINEKEIIEILCKVLGQPRPPYSKIGDDVAYFPLGKKLLVVKSDMLVGKTDVPPQMKLWQAARKSVVMCASDFASKGVVPSAILISLGLPRKITRKEVKELAIGFKKAKEEFSIEILGGDTNETDDLIIDCTMLGFSKKVVTRGGASEGDFVVVSGVFGYPSSGLRILLEGYKTDSVFKRKAVSSVLYPKARLKLGLALSKKKLFSSSIDSSDGLALSLYEIACQSCVGIKVTNLPKDIYVEKFANDNNIPLEDLVLYGGEEYEIVGTIPRDRFKEARDTALGVNSRLIHIGHVLEAGSGVNLSTHKGVSSIQRRGWIHFT